MLLDFDCPSGAGYLYICVLSREKADVIYLDRIGSSISFGGFEFLATNEQGEFERQTDIGPSVVNRDLRALDASNPFGFVAPSFPDTKFFVLKAPDGLEVSNIPRSFGSVRAEAAETRSMEIELAGAACGTLHYQIFCRAFSEQAEPEELTSFGSVKIEPSAAGKVRVKLAGPLILTTAPEHSHYRVEIILAFVADVGGGPLYLRQPPCASKFA